MADWTVHYYEDFADELTKKDQEAAVLNRFSIHGMLEKHGLDVLKLSGGGIKFYKQGKDIVAVRNGFEYLVKINTRDKQKGSFTVTKVTLLIKGAR